MSEEAKDKVVDGANSAEPSTQTTEGKTFEDFMKSQQFIDLINAEKGKAVENFRKDKLPGLIESEVENRIKARETKTPEQIRFEEYEAKLADMQNKIAEKERSEMRLKNKDAARAKLKEAQLPDSLLDFFVSEDSEKTNSNVEVAVKALDEFRNQIKQSVLSGNNIQVPGKTITGNEGTIKEPGPNATKEEWKAYWARAKKNK